MFHRSDEMSSQWLIYRIVLVLSLLYSFELVMEAKILLWREAGPAMQFGILL
jgi:hypothetical protein